MYLEYRMAREPVKGPDRSLSRHQGVPSLASIPGLIGRCLRTVVPDPEAPWLGAVGRSCSNRSERGTLHNDHAWDCTLSFAGVDFNYWFLASHTEFRQ